MPAPDFKVEDAIFSIKCNESDKYKKLFNEIKKSLAYQNPYANICINQDGIHFGHSLFEIEASFPMIGDYLGFKRLNERELNLGLCPEMGVYRESNRSELTKLAKNYFENLKEKKLSKQQYCNVPKENPDSAFIYLIEKNEGVAFGEEHSEKASKKLLFDNMPLLKKAGVTTIYFEHLLDTQIEMLNDYLSSPEMDMPIMLKDYLIRLDKGQGVYPFKEGDLVQPYTFLGLIMQAKKYGMKIVPFDTRASYDVTSIPGNNNMSAMFTKKDHGNRCLYMNYLAAKTVEEHQKIYPGKYIIFCGNNHTNNKTSGIAGMSEILGIPSLEVISSENDKTSIQVDSKVKASYVFGHEVLTPEPNVLISMPPTLSEEANLFLVEQEKLRKSNSKLKVLNFGMKQVYVSSEKACILYQIVNALGHGDQIRDLGNNVLDWKKTKMNKTLELLGIQVFDIKYHKTDGYWITMQQNAIQKMEDICDKHIKLLTVLKELNSSSANNRLFFWNRDNISLCEKLLALVQTNQKINFTSGEFKSLKNNKDFNLILETYPNLVKDYSEKVHSPRN